jgi:hypothetical protein
MHTPRSPWFHPTGMASKLLHQSASNVRSITGSTAMAWAVDSEVFGPVLRARALGSQQDRQDRQPHLQQSCQCTFWNAHHAALQEKKAAVVEILHKCIAKLAKRQRHTNWGQCRHTNWGQCLARDSDAQCCAGVLAAPSRASKPLLFGLACSRLPW